MSGEVNPYQSPETVAVPVKPLIAQGTFTETMLICLKQASPWLRFVGILGFICAGITAFSSVSFMAIIPQMDQAWSEIPGLNFLSGAFSAIFSGSMILLCLGGAVLIFFPSLFIFRCGERIRSYLRTGTNEDLELALKNNKSLWKFIGIYCIASLALIPLAIIGVIIIAVFAAVA